jgi:hypothetical protein
VRRRQILQAKEAERRPLVSEVNPQAAHAGWLSEQARMIAGTMLKGACPICNEKIGRGVVGHASRCKG